MQASSVIFAAVVRALMTAYRLIFFTSIPSLGRIITRTWPLGKRGSREAAANRLAVLRGSGVRRLTELLVLEGEESAEDGSSGRDFLFFDSDVRHPGQLTSSGEISTPSTISTSGMVSERCRLGPGAAVGVRLICAPAWPSRKTVVNGRKVHSPTKCLSLRGPEQFLRSMSTKSASYYRIFYSRTIKKAGAGHINTPLLRGYVPPPCTKRSLHAPCHTGCKG